MPRAVVVGLLAAVGAAMSALVGFARGDLVWMIIADAAAATGLGAYLALPPKKKVQFNSLLSINVDKFRKKVRYACCRPGLWPGRLPRSDGIANGSLFTSGVQCARRDTKTRTSRRTLGLPKLCVRVLREHQERQAAEQGRVGAQWQDCGLVFTTALGGQLDKDAVLRAFRKVVTAAGLNPRDWTPREQRHTFVSVLSDEDVPIEKISDLVGYKDQTTIETVYRHQIRPVVLHGAEAMDRIFPESELPG